MSGQATAISNFALPTHVPPELVLDYDSAHGPEVMGFPPGSLDGVREQRAVFYSTLYGGFWVFTQYDDIRRAFQDSKRFVQHMTGIPQAPYERVLIPLGLDGTDHMAYRRLMAPLFSPRQMGRLEPVIRRVARTILAKYAPTGQIEFAGDFALALSSAMFCGMLDLPLDQFPYFHQLSSDLVYGVTSLWKSEGAEKAQAFRIKTIKEIESFITALIPLRRETPGEDVISLLLAGEVFGRPVTEAEVINMAILLFFAGTDSTAGSVSFAHAFLSKHPATRQQLIDHLDDDDYVWNAGEELLRYHGFHHMCRIVSEDCEFAGVSLKKGETIMLPTASANRDGAHFPNPYEVDLERENARNHLTFGAGVHRCSGSHLATIQLRAALQEVHRAIPDYRLSEPVQYISGGPKVVPHTVRFDFTPTDFVA